MKEFVLYIVCLWCLAFLMSGCEDSTTYRSGLIIISLKQIRCRLKSLPVRIHIIILQSVPWMMKIG